MARNTIEVLSWQMATLPFPMVNHSKGSHYSLIKGYIGISHMKIHETHFNKCFCWAIFRRFLWDQIRGLVIRVRWAIRPRHLEVHLSYIINIVLKLEQQQYSCSCVALFIKNFARYLDDHVWRVWLHRLKPYLHSLENKASKFFGSR